MAEHSKIEWTDATVNFWWGCTKVGPGCDHCYAEAWSRRAGEDIWGVNAERRKIKSARDLILRLQRDAARFVELNRRPMRVFIQSMSDLFDKEVPIEWFEEAWTLIEHCDGLDIQVVTKRISLVEKRLAAIGRTDWPQHARLIISVVNQDEADRDVPRLLALKGRFHIRSVGLSMEPLLGAVALHPTWLPCPKCKGRGWYLARFADNHGTACDECVSQARAAGIVVLDGQMARPGPRLDWVIVGGESGGNARPMHSDWARSLRDQCLSAGVPFLFKQWGEWAPYDRGQVDSRILASPGSLDMPVQRFGKKLAGRLLDGVQHDGMPA